MDPNEGKQASAHGQEQDPEYIGDPIGKDELTREQPEDPGGALDLIDDPIPRRHLLQDVHTSVRFVLALSVITIGFAILLVVLLRCGMPVAREVWSWLSPILFLVIGYYFGGKRRNKS